MDSPQEMTVVPPNRRVTLIILAGLGIPWLLSVALAVLLFSSFLSYLLVPGDQDGFAISKSSCRVDVESSHALVQLSMTPTQDFASDFRVEPSGSNQVFLRGVGVLEDGRSLESLDLVVEAELHAQLLDDDNWVELQPGSTNVVLEFARDTRQPRVHLDEIRLWWSGGEPAWVQRVPIGLEWTDRGCSVTTG